MRLINRKRNPNFYYSLCPREMSAFFFFFSEADNWESDVFHLVEEGGGRGQL